MSVLPSVSVLGSSPTYLTAFRHHDSLVSPDVRQCLRLSCFPWSWHFWTVLIRYFVEHPLHFSSSAIFSIWDWRYGFGGKKTIGDALLITCQGESIPCCYSKLPWIQQLKTTEIYSFNNAEGQKSEMSLTWLKSRCWQALFFVEAPGKAVPYSFHLLGAPTNRLVIAGLQSLLLESWIILLPPR